MTIIIGYTTVYRRRQADWFVIAPVMFNLDVPFGYDIRLERFLTDRL